MYGLCFCIFFTIFILHLDKAFHFKVKYTKAAYAVKPHKEENLCQQLNLTR